MAYVTPSTALTGDLIAAADWNKNTVDNPIALKALIDAIGTAGLNRCNGRLTLTTGTPVTTANVTAATTLYWTPYGGNQVALYDGAAWAMYTFTESSIAVPASTSQMYDVFVYNNAGTITLELTAWTNDTTRATALVFQNGVYVKTGALTRRYLGSFRTTTVSGQTEDSLTKRFLFNYYNRVSAPVRVLETGTWTYTTATIRQANASTANQIAVVQGVAETPINLQVFGAFSNTTVGVNVSVGNGQNTTTAFTATAPMMNQTGFVAGNVAALQAAISVTPAEGFSYFAWNEFSTATGTTTFYGVIANRNQSGLFGIWVH